MQDELVLDSMMGLHLVLYRTASEHLNCKHMHSAHRLATRVRHPQQQFAPRASQIIVRPITDWRPSTLTGIRTVYGDPYHWAREAAHELVVTFVFVLRSYLRLVLAFLPSSWSCVLTFCADAVL